MGFHLRREVRDALPPGKLTAAERLLVLEIADQCSDRTRLGWPGAELLAELTDLSPRSIQETLSRVREKWEELRVPLGTDKHGKPYYSHAGRRTTFRIPVLAPLRVVEHPGDVDTPDEGAMNPGASTDEGAMNPGASGPEGATDPGASGPDSGKRCDGSVSKVRQIRGPLPQGTSQRTSLSPQRLSVAPGSPNEREIMASPKDTPGYRAVAELGVEPELIGYAVAALEKKHSIKGPGWWITAKRNGSLAAAVEEVLAARQPAEPDSTISRDAHVQAVSLEPECPHGSPGGNVPKPDDGWIPCSPCRRSTPRLIELVDRRAG